MPTTKQAMDLIQDSIYGDKDHFRQVAISIANNLKKRKHSYEAKQIMDWLNDVQVNNETHEGLIKYEKPSLSFDDLILPKELKDQLREVVLERQKRVFGISIKQILGFDPIKDVFQFSNAVFSISNLLNIGLLFVILEQKNE